MFQSDVIISGITHVVIVAQGSKCFLQISTPEAFIRLEIRPFSPFIPCVDKNQFLVIFSMLLCPFDQFSKPITILSWCRTVINCRIDASASRIVPSVDGVINERISGEVVTRDIDRISDIRNVSTCGN
jgi:hypothetical protein